MNKDKLSNDRRAAAGLSLAWPADCLINITFSEFLIKINGAYVPTLVQHGISSPLNLSVTIQCLQCQLNYLPCPLSRGNIHWMEA